MIKGENYKIFLQGKIVAVCEAILSEEIGIILGSRKLKYLSHLISDDYDKDFMVFIGVDSETDHLPVDWERKNWSIEALQRKDVEIKKHEEGFKEIIFSACEKLIKKFDIKESSPLT